MSIRPTKKSRSRRALVIALTAALGALAVAGATLGYVLADDDTQPHSAAPSATAKSPACAEVTRQYSWWDQETRSLVGLRNLTKAEAKASTDKLIADSKALRQTLDRYREASVQQLANAIIDYEVEVAMLAEDIDRGMKADTLVIGGTLLAEQKADDAYTAFLRASC